MILNTKTNLNFLVGLINIAQIDGKTLNEVEPLLSYYQEKNGDIENQKLKDIFKQRFDADLADKEWSLEKKDLFFNIAIMVAFLDEFSQKEEIFIKDLADKLSCPQDKVEKIIIDLKYETGKNLDFNLLYWFSRMIKGYVNYLETGITKFDAYYSFRHLHFLTNNRMNLLMIFLAEVFNSQHTPSPSQEGNLRNGSEFQDASEKENINDLTDQKVLGNKISEVVSDLREKGYFVFNQTIDENIVDKIYNFANNQNSYPIFSDKKFSDCFIGEGVSFKNSEYVSTRYEYPLKGLLENPDVFEILLKEDFTKISQEFFNSKSLLSCIHLWWTTPIRDDRDRYTGQVFHIDIDRSLTLLFMIYINDVDENNGPHVYVKGSHKDKPHHLLEDRRMNEEELAQYYSKENLIEVKGKKGTVIAIDPLGFHRGKPLNQDNRLALKYEFSTDGFGELLANLTTTDPKTKAVIEKLNEKYDYTFSKFI